MAALCRDAKTRTRSGFPSSLKSPPPSTMGSSGTFTSGSRVNWPVPGPREDGRVLGPPVAADQVEPSVAGEIAGNDRVGVDAGWKLGELPQISLSITGQED